MIDLMIRNATTVNSAKPMDFAVNEGKILECGRNLSYRSIQELDVEQRLLLPGFVDPHVHLDIALMNSMAVPGRQKRILSPSKMNDEIERRRSSFTIEDIKERASTALEMASRHGVTTVRAQCHVDVGVGLKHLQALKEVKDEYAGRVDVQIVAFPNQGLLRHPGTIELFHEAFKSGADVMGGGSNLDIEMKGHIDTALDMAIEYDVDFDIHSDLGLSDHVELEDLETVYLARRTIEKGYRGRVTAGHVCTLGSAESEVAKRAIELIKEADISVVSQPDLYRLGREDSSNTRRGLTRVLELLEAGVNVTYASNNIRDGYRPMGNFDPLEEALILSYGAHMDTVDDFNTLMTMSTYNGAKAANLDNYGLEPGCNADMVVLDARSPSAAIVGQAEKRYIFKSGRLMAENRVLSTHYHGRHLT